MPPHSPLSWNGLYIVSVLIAGGQVTSQPRCACAIAASGDQEAFVVLAGDPCRRATAAGPRCAGLWILVFGLDCALALPRGNRQAEILGGQSIVSDQLLGLSDRLIDFFKASSFELLFEFLTLREEFFVRGHRGRSVVVSRKDSAYTGISTQGGGDTPMDSNQFVGRQLSPAEGGRRGT